MILKEEFWGGPNPPGEEGGGTLVGEAASVLRGEWISGPPPLGASAAGEEKTAKKPTGCLTYPRSHPLERNTTASHAGYDDARGSSRLTYPIYLLWSAIFLPLGVFAA